MTFGVAAAGVAASSNSDNVVTGVLGFLVVAAMGVALVFLLLSMNKQFRKITPSSSSPSSPPDPPDVSGPQEPSGGQDAKAPAQTPN